MERTDFGVAVIVNWTATKQNIHLIASSFLEKTRWIFAMGRRFV